MQQVTYTLLILTLNLKLSAYLVQCTAYGAQCDFEKYGSVGCFSQANLRCDHETNTCLCHPETPVSIEGRICVERVKPYKSCHYDDQCDNSEGFYCVLTNEQSLSSTLPLDPRYAEPCQSYSGSAIPKKCKCLKVAAADATASLDSFFANSGGADQAKALSEDLPTSTVVRHRHQHNEQHQSSRPLPAQETEAHNLTRARPALPPHYHNYKTQNTQSKHSSSHEHHHEPGRHPVPTSSIFSRIIWIFLILSLLSLMLLLFVIKYHSSFGASERPLHRTTDDRTSIDSELDVPPPYEVAIRMKV